MEDLDCEDFNCTCLMPSLIVEVYVLSSHFSIPTLFFCILVHGDVELKCLYQDAPTPRVPIDPPYLP